MAKLVWTLSDRSPISQHLVIRLTNSTKQLLTLPLGFSTLSRHFHKSFRLKEKFGQLVLLGFDVTTFTPAAYQRRSLQRPSKEI